MKDFSELKAAAEACKDALPLRYMGSPGGSLSIRNDHGIVFGVHQNRSFPAMLKANKAHADLVLAASPSVILDVLEENEALREEGSNWRYQSQHVLIEVWFSEGDDPFVCAISGAICISVLVDLQKQLIENKEDDFDKGSGLYVFRSYYESEQVGDGGRVEMPGYWDLDFLEYKPFDFDEGEALKELTP